MIKYMIKYLCTCTKVIFFLIARGSSAVGKRRWFRRWKRRGREWVEWNWERWGGKEYVWEGGGGKIKRVWLGEKEIKNNWGKILENKLVYRKRSL